MEVKEDAHNFYTSHQISPPSPLFDAMTDTYYFAKNVKGQFVHANQLLNEHYDLESANAVIGKTDYDFFRTDIADNIRADDLKVMQNDLVITNKLEVVQDGDGSLRWLFTTKSALKDATGNVIGVEGFSKDAQKSQTSIEPYNAFKDCIEHLRQNFMNPITVSELADISCMSVSTFERKFKKHFGSTPNQYIKRYRIQEACRLLLAGYSIQKAALDCGFCDQSYFTREFRIFMGMTPKNYQQQQMKSAI